ncbi:hypothetical protein ACFDTO_02605 [Microbacteriaceae bacterium 4G12]
MSDDLVVSGGGSTAVATEELLEHAQDLERIRDGLEGCRDRLASWPLIEEVDGRVTNHLTWARGAVGDALLESESLARALRLSAERYGALERSLTLVQRTAGESVAYWAGMLLPGLVLTHGPAVALALAVGAAAIATPEGRAAVGGAGDWLRDNPGVVNNALVASLTRTAVSSVDDFGLGAVLAPPAARHLLGEHGLDLGLPVAGAVITGAAGAAGLLRESRVAVRRVPLLGDGPRGVAAARTADTAAATATAGGVAGAQAIPAAVPAPRGFADLAARVPRTAPEGAQIRVEQYGDGSAGRRFVVYVAGTADASPRSSADPWDVTSDIGTVTGADAGAVRATEQAMREAGVGPGDRVLLAGYSLGGIVAREVANRGTFPVAGVLTLGAPVGQIPVPDGVAAVSVEHSEDVLAALGGHGLAAEDGGNAVVVRRSVAAELAEGGTTLFAAHGFDRYAETAALLDDSDEERIRDFRATLTSFLGDREQGTVSLWRADRVPETGSVSPGRAGRADAGLGR